MKIEKINVLFIYVVHVFISMLQSHSQHVNVQLKIPNDIDSLSAFSDN